MRWELEQSFDGQLCQKCLHQKLLKSINLTPKVTNDDVGMLFDIFLFILKHISFVQFTPGSGETDIG